MPSYIIYYDPAMEWRRAFSVTVRNACECNSYTTGGNI